MYAGAGESDECLEVGVELLVSCCEASEVFESGEAAFDWTSALEFQVQRVYGVVSFRLE
jgi:hypothetical protein